MSVDNRSIFGGVYAIRHIDSGKLYVGSAVDFSARWRGHRGHLNRGTHHSRSLQSAWNKYGSDAFLFEILEFVQCKGDLISTEQQYLDNLGPWMRGVGYNLSPTAGSCLGVRHSPEVRARQSEIKKNQSPETRAKISEANKRRVISPETRAKMSASQKNRAPETFAKFREARKGRKLSPEHREKLVLSLKRRTPGFTQSPETRAKIAIANTGKKRSQETRAKMSVSIKAACQRPETQAKRRAAYDKRIGSKASPETRAKLSASAKKRAPEIIARLRKANVGRKLSQEHRAKISARLEGNKNALGQTKPARPCMVCGKIYKPLRKERCKRCSRYFYAHGHDKSITSKCGQLMFWSLSE